MITECTYTASSVGVILLCSNAIFQKYYYAPMLHEKKRQCKPPPSTTRSEHGKVLIILLNPENDEPVGSNHVDLPLNIMVLTFPANHVSQ